MRVTIRKVRQVSANKKHKSAYEVRTGGRVVDKFWTRADANKLANKIRKQYKGYK